MSENTERLDAIQRRIDAATPGAVTITPSDVAFLLDLARKQQAALDAVTARLDEWDSYKPWPDAEETQVWYSSGKRHASEAVRALIADALEAKS